MGNKNLLFLHFREDILIFLTGQEEIDSAVQSIRDLAKDVETDLPPMIVCPLYAALPSHLQLRVFQPTPKVKAFTNSTERGHINPSDRPVKPFLVVVSAPQLV